MSAKTRFLAVLLLLCTLCTIVPVSAVVAWAEEISVTEKEDAMQKIESDTTLSAYKQGDTQTVANDGYIGIPVEVTVYYDYATHGAAKSGYNGTPVILYVINSGAERIGTDSDTDIIKSMLERGYAVLVTDYKNHAKAVSPALEYSAQKIRTKARDGGFFKDKTVFPSGTYRENHVCPAGHDVSLSNVFFELDKHGQDGGLEKIVEVWNYDFRGCKAETVIKWVYEDGSRKATQNGWDGSEPVWYADAAGKTVDNANGQYIKVKHTWAKSITDCVKKDGTPIDLNLYMHIIYPTNPGYDVPVMTLACSSEHLAGGTANEARPYLVGFSFSGYAVSTYDFEYVPMSRDDHYGYFSGDATGGVTGINGTFALGAYNRSLYNTAAMRYLRYLSINEHDTYSFDNNKFGIYGNSKGGFKTFLGSEDAQGSMTLAELGEGATKADLESYVSNKASTLFREGCIVAIPADEQVTVSNGSASKYLTFDGSSRYENGKTETVKVGNVTIDGGELQPWLTYTDENGVLREIPCDVQWVYSSCGGNTNTITSKHAPLFTAANYYDSFGSGYTTHNYFANLMRIYDIPSMFFETPLEHSLVSGNDMDHGVDTYMAFFYNANYWLKDEAVSVAYTTPVQGDAGIKTTDDIVIKFYGPVSAEEIAKVTVTDSNGNAADGEWVAAYGKTEWSFKPVAFDGGESYTVTVPAELCGSNGKAMGEDYVFTFGTEAELSANFALNAPVTVTNANGTYFSFTAPAAMAEGYNAMKLRFKIANNAANVVNVYAASSTSDTAGKLLGTVNLSGDGYYEYDVTDYVMSYGAGETVYFFVKTTKQAADTVTYTQNFADRGDFWMNSIINPEFVTEVAGESVTAVKATVTYGNSGSYGAKTYAGWYPVRMTNTKVINNGAAVTKADYGRTFTFTLRIYDTAERHLQLWFNDCTDGANTTGDYSYSRTVIKTKANEWMEVTVPYTVYEMDYGVEKQTKEFKVVFKSTGSTEMPIYIDKLTVTEHVTDAVITEAALVTASEGTKAYKAPESEAAFEVNGNTYNTWWDAIVATSNLTYEQFEANPEKGTIKLLRNFTYTLGSGNDIIASRATLKLDLNGYKLTLENGALFNIAAENKTKLTYTVTNGTIIVGGVTPIINYRRANAAGNGKVCEINFEGVDILNADNTVTKNIITSATSPDGASVIQTVNFTDCNVNIRRSELPRTPAVIFPVGSGNISTDYTFKGGSITASSFVKLQLAEDSTKIIFGEGSDGEMTTFVAPQSVKISSEDAYMSDRGFAYPVASKTVNGYTVYELESAKYSTKYGVIPDDKSPEEYPWALFKGGQLIGLYDRFTVGDNSLTTALEMAWQNLRGECKGQEAQIVLRRDYDMTQTTDANFANLAQIGGTLVIDLGEHTLTLKNGLKMLYMNGKYGYDKAAGKDHVFDSNIVVRGGTIIANDSILDLSSLKTDNAKYNKQKYASISFNETNIVLTGKNIVSAGSNVNAQYGAKYDVDFNNCNFDLTNRPANVMLFAGTDSLAMNDVTFTLRGGNITAKTFDDIEFTRLDADDKIFFDKDVNGKYITLTVPTSYKLPVIGGMTSDGVGVSFGGGTVSGENTVYTLQESDLVTKYGAIPLEYADADVYPFAVFSNGQFIGAFEKFVDNNDTDGIKYNGTAGVSSAMELARAILLAKMDTSYKAQILMRRDYTYASSEGGYNNLANIGGVLTIDLDGHTLTARAGVSIFYLTTKNTWDSATKKQVACTTNIVMENGKLVTPAAPIVVNTINGANYNGIKEDKISNFTFSNMTIEYTSAAATALPALLIAQAKNAAANVKNSFVNAYYNNCIIDMTAIGTKATMLCEGLDQGGRNLNNVNLYINGGTIKATNFANITLGTFNESDGVNGDSILFGQGEDGYTKLQSTAGNAPSYAVPTDKGDAHYGVISSANGVTVYGLGEQTKYGIIPYEYADAEKYPFVVFKNGVLLGAHGIWCQDNSPSAIYTARLAMVGKKGEGVTVTILVRRDYQMSNADNYYNNMAHVGGTLVVDLDGHTFTVDAGKPMFRAKSQTVGDSSGTYVCDTAIVLKNGTVVTKGETVFQLSTEVIAARFENYTREKIWNITCEGVNFVIPANGHPVVNTLDTANHELGSVFNVAFNNCTFDVKKSGATVIDGVDATSKNKVRFVVNGGKITSTVNGVNFFNLGEGDSIFFGKYDGTYVIIAATSGIPAQVFDTEDGKLVFTATDVEGEYTLAPCTHAYDNDMDESCNICGEIREVAITVEGVLGDRLTWKLENGIFTVSGTGKMPTLNSYEIPWLEFIDKIKAVVIEEGVTNVGRTSFNGAINLTTVTLPSTLKSIDNYAFFGCSALQEITVPAGVTKIGTYAFRKSGIKNVIFETAYGWSAGESVFTSEEITFDGANLLKTLYKIVWVRDTEAQPDAVEPDYVDGGSCGNNVKWTLTYVDESGAMKLTIGGNGRMTSFNSYDVPWLEYIDKITVVVIENGVTNVGRSSFNGANKLANVTLPSTLKTIEAYAFYGCSALADITVPANVTEIGAYAFRKSGVMTVTFETAYGWSTGETEFTASNLISAADEMLKSFYKNAWVRDTEAQPETADPNYVDSGICGNGLIWTLTYLDDTKTVMKLVISGQGEMTEFGATEAPWYGYGTSIVEVEVEKGVTTVGRCAFMGLKMLAKVTLYEGLTEIGAYAFNSCRSLNEIDIPSTVKRIGAEAFKKTGLKENYNAPTLMEEALSEEGTTQIKLLGDSITHGVGGTGFAQSGETIVGSYKRNPDGYCWANLFSDYMSEKYGASVVNNACTGRDIEFIINNFNALVDAEDDLIVVVIGTNNRHQYHSEGERRDKDEFLDEFYQNVIKLNAMFEAAGKRVVFVANIPASESNEQDGADYWRIFHMDDVNATYKRLSAELGASMISMYDLFNAYIVENGLTLDDLLKDGLHPNDEGYRIMFELFLQAFNV